MPAATVPMKVLNGLVHGSKYGYVILSPGTLTASANHTIECMNIIVNHSFETTKTLPLDFVLQVDGASNNKNMAVLGFMGLWVMEGVFKTCKLRMEMEHHAHDIYDAFHSIHTSVVRRHTYFALTELLMLVRAAHELASDVQQKNPLVGHAVNPMVLWDIRDFWEWLCPGYNDESQRADAMSRAAMVFFSRIRPYRDFLLQREPDSTEENPKVGLWAKPYMTSEQYEYKGTLLTKQSVADVIGNGQPQTQDRGITTQKNRAASAALQKFESALRGPYRDQFEGRLNDAMSMCKGDWGKIFIPETAQVKPALRRLPSELMAVLVKKGIRRNMAVEEHLHLAEGTLHDVPASHAGARMGRRPHVADRVWGFDIGERVFSERRNPKSLTDAEFLESPVTAGSFVITRTAPLSHWSRACDALKHVELWLWQVLEVYPPHAVIPGMSGVTKATHVYDAQIFQPDGKTATSKWSPTWELVDPMFLRTEVERADKVKLKGLQARLKRARDKLKKTKKKKKPEKDKRVDKPQQKQPRHHAPLR
eukprot:5935994-Amphidinium_carterae.1